MDNVESKVLGGTLSFCPRGRSLFLALAFYTIIICTICYITLSTTVSTQLVIKPTEPRTTDAQDDEYIISQANVSTNKTNQNATMTTVVERPNVRHYYRSLKDSQPLEKTCSSCAIVSSSGQLLGKGAGKEIDNASCVFRMNAAPVVEFEEDVGARTTLRVLCFIATKAFKEKAPSFVEGPGKAETILFWGLNQQKHKWGLTLAQEVSSKYMDSNVSFYSQMMDGEDEAGKLFTEETGYLRAKTGTWLSTGWFTVMLALDMCRDIHIYGMIPDEYCKFHQKEATKYHYYQKGAGPTECGYYRSNEASTKGGHRFITEKAVFARWGKKYNMKFHHPEWDLSAVNLSKPLNTPFARKQAILKHRRKRWQQSTNVLLTVIAVVCALLCVACLLGICSYPCEVDRGRRYSGTLHERGRHRIGQQV